MKIKDSQFFITGGNRGIGLAVAEMAARQQAHLILANRSTHPDLESHLRDLGAGSTTLIECDLSTRVGTEELAQKVKQMDIDIFFNNAGQLTGGLIEEQNIDDIYHMLQVNLNAVIHLSRAVLPNMIKKDHGKLINNSSVSAFMHFPGASTYAASKSAVVAFTDCIDMELTGTGVSTLCLITPGIKTRMFDEINEKYSKNLETPSSSISPQAYAEQIKEAILQDHKYLTPKGSTGIGLWTAKHLPSLFHSVVRKKFQR